jgi:hypothetical protein
VLRLIQEQEQNERDYIAYRTLAALCSGVGVATAKRMGDLCRDNHQNYRELFHVQALPHWLTGRPRSTVNNIRALTQAVIGWSLADVLANRVTDIQNVLTQEIFTSAVDGQAFIAVWTALAAALP